MKVISVHLFQANLQTKMGEQSAATSQPEETKAQSVLLSALELTECPAKELTKEVDEFPKTRQPKETPNDVKSVVVAKDQKMSSPSTPASLPVVSKTEEYKRKGIVEADRGSHNQRSRNPTYRGGYGMAHHVQTNNNSRPQIHGGEWVHPLNPQLLSSARQGYRVNTNNSPAMAPCLPPAPWLSMVPCLPPAPFLPMAPCLPQTTWLPMASPPPATWLSVAPPPPATWLPMAPPPPAMWLPVTSSSPSTTWLSMAPPSSGPMAPCLPPPAPWCPTAPWLSPAPYLPAAPWLPVAPALPSFLPTPPDHSSFTLQPVAPQPHFRETTLTAPSYSSRVKTLPPPPYSSFFTNTPPPLYSMAPLNPTAAPYSPPPAYSSSSPAANPEAASSYSSSGNPTVPPVSTSSSLNPAAPPYKSPSPVSSLPTPPAEPWIPPSKEPEPDAEPSFFSAAPFSEDPIFSTVWKPLAAELFASSKPKSKTACVESDWDPLSEYQGGSVWSSEC